MTGFVQLTANDLWDSARRMRAKTAYFALLFLKRLCALREDDAAEGRPRPGETAAVPPQGARRFLIPENCSLPDRRGQGADAGSRLNSVFRAIEDANPSLAGLFSCLDFSDKEAFPDTLLDPVLEQLDGLVLRDVEDSTFGDLCDEMMERFALDAPASGMNDSTPRQVARLIAMILQAREGMSIYDCACGTGRALVECCNSLKRRGKNAGSLRLYGQEIDSNTVALCRINLLCHGFEGATIEMGDTLRHPRHLTGDGKAIMSFDRVISHPPFNLKEWGFDEWSRGDPYGRADYGVPPRSSGELAFLEHSLASLNGRGVLVAVVPQGVLSRAGEEREIRQRILREDLIEAVIDLPASAFFSPSVSPCLLVLNKSKPKGHRGEVLFIDAGADSAAGTQMIALSDESVDRITASFVAFEDRERFSRVVSLDEIERNGFTLSVSSYIQKDGNERETDIGAEWQILLKLMAERNEAERKVTELMNRLERDNGA